MGWPARIFPGVRQVCLGPLDEGVDPLGENGEFHTFATHGPMFSSPVAVTTPTVCTRRTPWSALCCAWSVRSAIPRSR